MHGRPDETREGRTDDSPPTGVPRRPIVRRHAVLAVLLVLAICPYFVDLDGSSIWDANEAFYVETPREMIERGDYVTPTFNYELRLNKPVLSYWIVAGFYHAFGVSPGVQRIPIALGAMVMILTAFVLAWAASHRWPVAGFQFAAPSSRSPVPHLPLEAALWAAIGLAITPRLVMFARRIFIDIYISMFLGLTLLFFALSERYPGRRRLYLVLMYVAVGLGVMTKGPIAIVLPCLVFAAYLVVHRELGRVRSMMLPAGVLIVAAIVLPYHVALHARHGWEPIVSFLLGENVARFTEGVGVHSPRGPAFYLPVIFTDAFPWSMFLVAAALSWVGAWRAGRSTTPEGRVRTLLWLWIAGIVLFFTASEAKQDLYIFPIVPAVAALGALAVVEDRGLAVRGGIAVIGLVLAAAGGGLLLFIGSPNGVYGVEGAPLMGVTGVAGGLTVLVLAMANRRVPALLSMVTTLIVLSWTFVLLVLPGFERYKPAPGFADTLAARLGPDDAVVTYDEAMPSLVYYLRRHVDPIYDAGELVEAFRPERTVYAVMSDRNYAAMAPALPVPTCIVERRPIFDVRLRNMLAREPLPELVLVTNRCPVSTPNAQLPTPRSARFAPSG
jgi:4-amino-4-deoxy-L-arabinose transferase-like glycosyltransferase